MAAAKSEWSLSEAAGLLGQPQHRLIYLCEKGVVVPDLGDAHGRGSSRRFSARNLLEFEVALKLRELTVPVTSVATVIYALRAFEAKVSDRLGGFRLPYGLTTANAAELTAILTDEGRLFFSLRSKAEGEVFFGGVAFGRLARSRRTRRRSKTTRGGRPSLVLPRLPGPSESTAARLEVNLTRLARDLNPKL